MKTSKLLASTLIAAGMIMPLASHAADSMKADTSNRTVDRASPKVWVKDSAITTQVKAELAAKKLASLTSIKVDTDANGAVQLSGTAKTQAEVQQAESIAKGVKGVTSVDNQIMVKM